MICVQQRPYSQTMEGCGYASTAKRGDVCDVMGGGQMRVVNSTSQSRRGREAI